MSGEKHMKNKKLYNCEKCGASEYGIEVSYYVEPPVIEVFCRSCNKIIIVKELS